MSLIIFIIVLVVLIFVHELGHFTTAKLGKLRVDEFGFGFPPRITGKKIGKTLYSLNWLPFGGFVKIYGEDGSGRNHKDSFAAQSFWRKFIILIAGATMNFLLGWFIISVLFASTGIRMGVSDDMRNYMSDIKLTITQVVSDSPADLAGLMIGDFVSHVISEDNYGNKIIHEPKTYGEFVGIIDENKGKEIALVVDRGKDELVLQMSPRVSAPENEGALGIAIPLTGAVTYPSNTRAIKEGFILSVQMSQMVVIAFTSMLMDLVTTAQVSGSIMGPVGIVGIVGDAFELGWTSLFQLTALISLNLAVLNLLPIPALDGGRILFLFIEKIRGVPFKKEVEQYAHAAGFVFLVLLLIVVTIKDVISLL